MAFLPRAPQYCRWTPTECLPCLGKLVSSMTKMPVGRGEGLGHGRAVALPDGLLVPGALADELLEGLVEVLDVQAGREGDLAGERLDALALAVEDQALEVDAGVLGLAGPVEVVAEAGGVIAEPVEDFGCEFGGVGAVHTLDTNRPGRSFVAANGVVLVVHPASHLTPGTAATPGLRLGR